MVGSPPARHLPAVTQRFVEYEAWARDSPQPDPEAGAAGCVVAACLLLEPDGVAGFGRRRVGSHSRPFRRKVHSSANWCSTRIAVCLPLAVRRTATALTRYRHRPMETVYDLLRIGASALVIVGVLFLVFGLIGYWSTARRA